jgi:hypothetical protein
MGTFSWPRTRLLHVATAHRIRTSFTSSFPANWNPRLDEKQHITLVLASMAWAACGGIVVSSSTREVMTMTTSQHTHCQPDIWRPVRGVALSL